MKQIQKYIIVNIIFIIIIIAATPRHSYDQEHFSFGGAFNAVNNIVKKVAAPVVQVVYTVEKGIPPSPPVPSYNEIERLINNLFNGFINPIKDGIYKAINIVPTEVGVKYTIKIIKYLNDMSSPTVTIINNLVRINQQLTNILNTVTTDNNHIKNITPIITRCTYRIDYCRQRVNNVSTCIKLLQFMIKKRRLLFIKESLDLTFSHILETIYYIKMAIRTTFIDIHNTTPPLWKVISVPKYKRYMIKIIKYTKQIVISVNTLLDKLTFTLKAIKDFLSQPKIINALDITNVDRKINTFYNVLNKQIAGVKMARFPTILFDMPLKSVNINNKVLYNVIKKIIESISVPPEYDHEYNIAYINKHIKNHPYPI